MFLFLKKMVLSMANLSHFYEIVHLEVLVIVIFCKIGDKSMNGRELFIGVELFIERLAALDAFCQGDRSNRANFREVY